MGGTVNVRRRGSTSGERGGAGPDIPGDTDFLAHICHPVSVMQLFIIDFCGQSLHMLAKRDLSQGLVYGCTLCWSLSHNFNNSMRYIPWNLCRLVLVLLCAYVF